MLGVRCFKRQQQRTKGEERQVRFQEKRKEFYLKGKSIGKSSGERKKKVRSARAVLILKRTVYWGQAYTIRAYSPNAKVSVAGSCLSLSAERGDRSYKAQSKILEGSVFQSVW